MILEVNSEEEMKKIGEKIGQILSGGELIELIGDVGTGKTTLVKGIAKGLDIKEYVQSPSFTITRVYDAKDGIKLYHYDFYRLEEAGIMADELKESSQDSNAITIIEWADIIKGVLPPERLTIRIISTNENIRQLDFSDNEVTRRLVEAIK